MACAYVCIFFGNFMSIAQVYKIYNHIFGENVQTQTFCGARSWDSSGPAWPQCLQVLSPNHLIILNTSMFYWIRRFDELFYLSYSPPSVRPPLAPEDEDLLRDDEAVTPIKKEGIKRKERPTDKGVAWLVKTQYISPLSMESTKQVLDIYVNIMMQYSLYKQ